MQPRPPAYVAAPYAAEHPEIRAWHVDRATLIARILVAEGLAPILVHRNIVPLFGEETPATREIGLACDVALVDLVARDTRGVFAALLRNDGIATDGMRLEFQTWQRRRGFSGTALTGPGVRAATWEGWGNAARAAGLEAAWRELENPRWRATHDDTPRHGAYRSRRSQLGPNPAGADPASLPDWTSGTRSGT